MEQLAIWKRRNKRMRPISINFSPVHLARDDDYVTYLLSLLKTYDVSSEYIKIEVTETLFSGSNQQKAEDLIKRLFDAGISIALDNFGMAIRRLPTSWPSPASIIKIDKEFVDTFLVDGNAENFEQLVRLAHGLGRKVVVVGVDKKWQIDVCRRAQLRRGAGLLLLEAVAARERSPVQTPRVAANDDALGPSPLP